MKVFQLFHDEKSFIKYISVVGFVFFNLGSSIIFRGKISFAMKKKREEVTKALPFDLTCGNILYCTGIFKSKGRVENTTGLFPGRYDIIGLDF